MVEYLPVKEYAKRYNLHPNTVRRMIKAGELPTEKFRGTVRIRVETPGNISSTDIQERGDITELTISVQKKELELRNIKVERALKEEQGIVTRQDNLLTREDEVIARERELIEREAEVEKREQKVKDIEQKETELQDTALANSEREEKLKKEAAWIKRAAPAIARLTKELKEREKAVKHSEIELEVSRGRAQKEYQEFIEDIREWVAGDKRQKQTIAERILRWSNGQS